MTSQYGDHFRQHVRRVLPRDGVFEVWEDSGDLVLQVSWKLLPTASGKRSRPVQIVISQEALEDYAAAGDRERALADSRFEGFLRSRLATFDPNHDHAFGPPPPSRWLVTSRDLNG